ncbi:MAG: penicillin-binding protein 2 [Sedimentisphaerales bacterium]|nr:penicillin-binding protein 2 [Sedimentisphaerales bacterium]
MFSILALAFFALAGRCLYLQLYKTEHYKEKSLRQQQKTDSQTPQRGTILDCRGRVLAASNQRQTIFAEPRRIKNPERVATEMAPVLKTEARLIYKKIIEGGNPGFARIAGGVNFEQCSQARKIDAGIGVLNEWQRYYPMGRLLCHIVGFTSDDNRGLDGIELKFDEVLQGSGGSDIYFADRSRRTIRPKETASIVRDGQSLILTIDSTIQEFARGELEKRYLEYEAESATAIVAEPHTGAILAMVSLPDFDPSDRNCDANNFRNRAITDQFEPGSMLKPITAAIALDAGVVNRHKIIFCENGSYSGKGFGRIGEYGNHEYGNLTVREILVKSSNIGMAKIGQRLKEQKLYNGLKLFGFGKETRIDLPGEVSGLLRMPDKWTGYSVTRIPFGQEITVTSLQMIRAFCILSNGGRAVTPYVVEAIVDNDGTITKIKRPPRPALGGVGFIIDPQVADWIVKDALVGVVNEKQNGGTGWRAKLDKWQVYGKTGTANIALESGRGYSENDYVASFIAGAPAENPAIVVLVSIRKPNRSLGKGYTGGAVASPVAGKIIEKTLTYMERQGLL